ncbi:MAG: hypothetical protein WC828_08685 [Thermoleophilia bacterium]
MTKLRMWAAVSVILVAAAAITIAACGSTSQSNSLETLTDDLVNELSANYEVATGYPELYTNADCDYTYAVLKNCVANNPAAPYILPIIPTWPNEFSDPALQNMLGPTREGTSGTYRLDPREAIVVFGTLPPAGRYTSLQTYVATRQGSYDQSSPAYQTLAAQDPAFLNTLFLKLPQNPSRIESFSSVGNAINNVVIDQQSGASFGTLRFFIITPDAGMDQAVRSALSQLGVSSADIFTEPVSYTDMHLGLDMPADDFFTVMRYALPNDPNAGDDWRNTLPLSVLRVRENPSSTRAAQPFPISAYDARSATPEAQYVGDLNDLIGAVCKRWGSCDQPAPLIDVQAPPINDIGPSCRQIGMNCIADGQDTPYYYSSDLPLDHGEIYAVADTLATETGNATYVSIGINDSSKLLGVASVDDPALKGSAGAYASTVNNTDKLFVYFLTRNCAGLENLTDGKCLSITNDMVPPGVSIKLSLRDYVFPGTARGPDSAQLLKPTVVRVSQP